MRMFKIEFAEGVLGDLRKLRAYDRGAIVDAIEQHLSRAPNVPSKKRKPLASLVPPFEAVPPVWELRIREYRVFYDVAEEERKVIVRAVRRKPPHRTTEDIL